MPPSPRIEPTLLRVLTDREGTPFTRDELLESYRALQDEHGRKTRASWQFIDRNLLRLSKAGLLDIQDDCPDQVRRYLFGASKAPPPSTTARPKPATLGVLRKKLQQHRIELLTTIGETEAYDEVCSDLPELQADIQTQYNEARDRSVKLLGRIRALESLIANQDFNAQ